MVKPPTRKRDGNAFWLASRDAELLRELAAAEDRTMQAVLRRALVLYAEQSAEYQARSEAK